MYDVNRTIFSIAPSLRGADKVTMPLFTGYDQYFVYILFISI